MWRAFAMKHVLMWHRWFWRKQYLRKGVLPIVISAASNSLRKPRVTTSCVSQMIMWNGLHTYFCPDTGFPCTRRFRTPWHWRYHFGTNLVPPQIQRMINCITLFTPTLLWCYHRLCVPWLTEGQSSCLCSLAVCTLRCYWLIICTLVMSSKQVFWRQNCDALRRRPRVPWSVKQWHRIIPFKPSFRLTGISCYRSIWFWFRTFIHISTKRYWYVSRTYRTMILKVTLWKGIRPLQASRTSFRLPVSPLAVLYLQQLWPPRSQAESTRYQMARVTPCLPFLIVTIRKVSAACSFRVSSSSLFFD